MMPQHFPIPFMAHLVCMCYQQRIHFLTICTCRLELLLSLPHPNPFSKSKEVQLAIQLCTFLMLHYTERKGPSGGLGYGSGNLGSPVDGGGNLSSNSKQG